MTYVIPLILSEEVVKLLPEVFLERLSSCSSDVVIGKVRDYLDNYEADEECKSIVRDAYHDVLMLKDYINSESVKEDVELLQTLSYASVSPALSISDMSNWIEIIERIVGNRFSTPYIPPIKGNIIRDLITDLKKIKSDNRDYFLDLAYRLKVNVDLFRDPPHSHNKGTVLKKVLRNRDKYFIIANGLKFMIKNKKANRSPASWRYI